MHVAWIKKAKTKADKEERQKEIRGYKNAFDEAIEVLEELKEEMSLVDYDSPSWAYKQADINGANRKLQQIIDILNLKE